MDNMAEIRFRYYVLRQHLCRLQATVCKFIWVEKEIKDKSRAKSRTPMKASSQLRFNEKNLIDEEVKAGSLIRSDGSKRSYNTSPHIKVTVHKNLRPQHSN